MPRTLDPAAAAETLKNATAPVVVLRLDLAAPVGTKWYSDRALTVAGLTIEPRIASAGRILDELAAGRRPSVTDATFELRDDDGEIRSALEAVELQGASATVYQHFEGLTAATMTPLLEGVASGWVEYREADCVVRFDVTDCSRKWAVDVGHAADRDAFPNIEPRDEGRMLPIVFGSVRRARAACVRTGRRGTLLRDCGDGDSTLYVSGFESLEGGTALTLEIGRERVTGTVDGTRFTVTQRGGGTVASGTTTHDTGRLSSIRDTGLGGVDNEYVGLCLKVWITGALQEGDVPFEYLIGTGSLLSNPATSGWEYRLIRRFDASTGTIEYWPPFTVEGTRSETPALTVYGAGQAKLVHAGTHYEITTVPAPHRAGDRVREVVPGGWTYILNDAPSVRVATVYLYGRRVAEPVVISRSVLDMGGGAVGVLASGGVGEEDPPFEFDTWVPVDPELYEVDLADTTTFPALGRAITTVTFRRDPTALPGLAVRRGELRADLSGVESAGDGTGALVRNPADVIRALVTRWGGLDGAADVDSGSFDAAAASLAGRRFAFSLREMRDLPTVASELAFQATCVFRWRAGKASIKVLPRGAGAPDHSLDSVDRVEGGLVLSWDNAEDLVTQIVARFTEDGEPRELVVRDETAAGAWGVRTRACDFWAFADSAEVERAGRFWLARWCEVRRRAIVSTFLTTLEVEPGDVVAFDCDEFGGSPVSAEVAAVRHRPGSGVDGRMAGIDLDLRLPLTAGCSSSCELACESGCESACEGSCQSACESGCEVTCEAACQGLCELDCAAAAEFLCATACMAAACEVACEVFVTGLDGWGCGACETACQVACEAACESVCEAYCESSCESTCESSCESACESACESTCESGCESENQF
jgi:hypothetical protein